VVGEVLQDEAGDDEAEPGADAQQGGDEPDPARHPLGRQLVADDPEGQRVDGAAGALDDASGQHERQ